MQLLWVEIKSPGYMENVYADNSELNPEYIKSSLL